VSREFAADHGGTPSLVNDAPLAGASTPGGVSRTAQEYGGVQSAAAFARLIAGSAYLNGN
jgi:hypothetical protein